MCLVCGVTQAPVCAAAGPCTLFLQQFVALALTVGGAALAIGREWIFLTINNVRARFFVRV